MRPLTMATVSVSLLLSAAIFGFFYAWLCSTMWGLDAADPRVAIAAMQAMNASVRNFVFAPAFFGTPIALAATALLLFQEQRRYSATAFAVAGATYFFLAFIITATANLPMNEALAAVQVPDSMDAARRIWHDYSQPWQFWNLMRTLGSGITLLFAMAGLFLLGRDSATITADRHASLISLN